MMEVFILNILNSIHEFNKHDDLNNQLLMSFYKCFRFITLLYKGFGRTGRTGYLMDVTRTMCTLILIDVKL